MHTTTAGTAGTPLTETIRPRRARNAGRRHVAALGTIADAFRYWSEFPTLAPIAHVPELRDRYRRNPRPGHWFDPDTLRFFGSRNLHIPAAVRGVTVETQTNAPEGCERYAVTAWVLDGEQLEPVLTAKAHTLAAARRIAADVHAAFGTDAARTAWRLVRDGFDPEEAAAVAVVMH